MLSHSMQELPRALQHLMARDQDNAAVAEMPRRAFLKLGAASGFALGVFPLLVHGQGAGAPEALKPTQLPGAFVAIAADSTVTITVNRLEFGQGVQTALPMILAEELDADWSKVRSQLGTNNPAYADPLWGIHFTGGSTAIKHSFAQYRELGARARVMLVQAAAARWGVDATGLRTQNGAVLGAGGLRLSYGELAEAAMALPVPASVTLKKPEQFRIIGRPTTRLDAAAKSSGRQDFGIDVSLPGQLTTVIARPPVFGAKLKSVDDAAARAVQGVKAVLRVSLDRGAEGVAIIADGYWPAKTARDTLKLVWDTAAVEKVDSARQLVHYRELAQQPGVKHFDADMAPLAQAPKKIEAEFVFPYLAHAPMEPLNCTVEFTGQGATLWVGSQFPGIDGMAAAAVLGLKPEQVQVRVQAAGGGFGRRGVPNSDYVVEACTIAKAAHAVGLRAPLRILWSREDDIKGGYYRPMHLHRAQIGFDADGKVLAWDHVIVGQSIMTGTLFEGNAVKNGVDTTAVEGMRAPYPLPMRLTVHHPKQNVPVLWWRSVGSTHTAFVMETLIDQIARETNQDPVSYRMSLFGNGHARHRAALQLAVDQSGYGKKKLPAGRAWGVAVHESFDSVVAYVVEASVKEGQPVLHKATAGVHCNLVINPRTVETQVQGAALMGLGMCLPGAAITLKDGVVEQQNFGDYIVARITDMPTISVHTVPSAEPPTGMGEPGLPPLAPAFANAISRLTGKPLRELPFRMA